MEDGKGAIIGGIFFIIIMIINIGECVADYGYDDYVTYENTTVYNPYKPEEVAQGLNLSAALEVLRQSKDAADFEKRLNAKGGVNNLDLDYDGNIDYVKVTEYGTEAKKGLSLSVDLSEGTQEIASIEIEKKEDQVNAQIAGNETFYGSRRYHHSTFSFTDFLILDYLTRPHRSYVSPYSYNNYPTTFIPRASRSNYSYASDMGAYTTDKTGTGYKSSAAMKSTVTSPNRLKSSYTTAQKNFTTRTSGSSGSGGFGRPSVRSSGSTRTRTYSGGK